ncbi:LysM peptidoglycan-binding domain-containing protein [Anaerocolumna sp. MB42-C2]|uniref:LysM peptidoglycan-binding domain-containing protein n=1 Tax=Anaerocolumna sp. MB42-C2 TaxID=3070997 RepID=UPI0027DEF609|nr:LysM peptidoglycan-binding domain-containing protein [Anaerocolumna sp. MB42-C2]WMJ86871.1 LysM peptidoglycan-binding domain-containing protein [Anaerocolumna sp. MB42-C2]
MDIYVVQDGDTITSIANQFGVTETRLILDNGISNPYDLVFGQTIVITYPQKTYLVQEGDTLSEIAFNNGISIMQLYRNNPYLWDREFIYPGEVLIINYNTNATVTTNAYAFPFIDKNIAKKSLPYLTYLSILNYKTLKQGEIESFYDDSDLIAIAKYFGVAPLMLVTSVTFRGERNPELVNDILLNPDYQDRHAQNMLKIMKEKGYYGVNITITYLNKDNQELYIEYLKRITSHLNKEGFPVFVTIDPNFMTEENELLFEKVNYSNYNELVDLTYVMRFFWGTQFGPPMPVSSISDISIYVNYMKQMIAPQNINIGFPLLGYDWEIPYIEGFTKGNAITLDTAVELARITKSTILFDKISETPYYEYNIGKNTAQHIVWFVDARTIYAIVQLVIENELQGTGLWNIMTYYPQLWLIINSNFTIKKILPENSSDSL